MSGLHPILARAADGALPAWAVVSERRKRHLARVAACLDRWARLRGHPEEERARWRAAGYLHDALRDADPAELDPAVAPEWAPKLRHGPAVAARLRAEGVTDEELLTALEYHTVGHPELGTLGRFLYLADFLEPGRPQQPDWRAALRARLPEHLHEVLGEVAAERITRSLETRGPLLRETVEFWNRLVGVGWG